MEDIILYPGVEEDFYEAWERMKSEEIRMSNEVKTEIEIKKPLKSSKKQVKIYPVIEKHDSEELNSKDSDIIEEFHAVHDKIANYEEKKAQIEKIETNDTDPTLLIPGIQDAARSKRNPLKTRPLLLLCRLCAIPSDDRIHIFGPTAFHKTLLEKIQQCLPITVKETDTLPTAACPLCLEKLEACYQFNKAVERAEMKLRLYHDEVSHRLDGEVEIDCQAASQSKKPHIAMQNAVDGRELDGGFDRDANDTNLDDSDLDEKPSISSCGNQNTEPSITSLKLGRTSAPLSELGVCNSPPNSQLSEADFRNKLESEETVTNSLNHPSPNTTKQYRGQTRTHQAPTERSSYSRRLRKPQNYNFYGERSTRCNEEAHSDSETTQQQHILLVHNLREISSCKICGTQLGSEEEVDSHQEKHALQCIICEKIYRYHGSLRRHRQICSKNRNLTCDYCGKVFNQRLHLKQHVARHCRRQPFRCDLCSKTFRLKINRDRHHRTHSGERPFKCDFCAKTFTRKMARDEHHRIHTGERPFQCHFCTKAFIQKANRDRHHVIHTAKYPSPISCDFCERMYLSTASLRNHVKRNHRET